MKNRFIESQWLGIMHDSGDFCRGTFFYPEEGQRGKSKGIPFAGTLSCSKIDQLLIERNIE